MSTNHTPDSSEILSQMRTEAERRGFRSGENASQWRARNPRAAKQYSEWLDAHRNVIVRALSELRA